MFAKTIHREESGIAMITVVMGFFVVALLGFLLMSNSERQVDDAYRTYREDRSLAAAEAELERYAAHLTENGLYYLVKVDDAERARTCTVSSIPSSVGVVRQPGEAWGDLSCSQWDYQDPTAGWYESPFLTTTTDGERVEIGVEISPPGGGNPLQVAVVGRNLLGTEIRTVSATMRAESLSEYVRSSAGDLSYGSNVDVTGKIFAQGDLNFNTPVGTVHEDIYVSGRLTRSPNFVDGAIAYVGNRTGGQNPPQYLPFAGSPLDGFNFGTLWEQTVAVKSAACLGGGLCLDGVGSGGLGPTGDGGARSYLIEPSGDNLRIHYSTSSFSSSCSNTIMSSSGSSSSTWNWLGSFPVPENGAVWAAGDVMIGDRNFGTPGNTAWIEKSFTVYAGDRDGAADNLPGVPDVGEQHIVVNKSIMVKQRDGSMPGGSAVLALLTSGEGYFKRLAGESTGDEFIFEASLLTQGGTFRGSSCGSSNSVEFTIRGSLTSLGTGSMSGTFYRRNYGFDPRLEYIRPPFFPLVNDQWWWQDWRELPPPTWAQ